MKKILTIALCLSAAVSLSAQKVEQSSLAGNWYIDASTGVQMYVGDEASDNLDKVKPALNVEIGNWINPYVSLGAKLDLALADQTKAGIAVAVATFDITNIVAGFNNDKKFHVLVPVSAGASFGKHEGREGLDHEGVVALGLKASYDLNSNIALVAGINGYALEGDYDAQNGPKMMDFLPSLNIGLRFNISSGDSKLRGNYVSGRSYTEVRPAKNVKYGCPKGDACCSK